MSNKKNDVNTLAKRFRGYYPVVIDVETGGFNAQQDALLEVAAMTLKWIKRVGYRLMKTPFPCCTFCGSKYRSNCTRFYGY